MERRGYLHRYRHNGQLHLPAHCRLCEEQGNEHNNYQWWLQRANREPLSNQYFVFGDLDTSELIHKAEVNKDTLVDIVIPCYNEQDNIREVLDSIQAQAFDKYQIYIIDNHSTDDTLNVIKEHPLYAAITLYRNHLNLGPARSVRKAVQCGQSFFTMYASANDLWYPGYLGELVALHHQDSRASLVYAMPDLFEHGILKRSTQPEEFFETVGKDALSGFLEVWAKFMYGVTHLGLYKKDVIRNLLWPTMYRGGDHVVVAQAALFGHIRFVPKNLLRQNVVPNTNLQSWGFLESHLRCRDVKELYSIMGWHQFPYLSMLLSCYQAIEQALLQQGQKDHLIKNVAKIHFQRFGHLIRHEFYKFQEAQLKASSLVSLSERKAFSEIMAFVGFIKVFFSDQP